MAHSVYAWLKKIIFGSCVLHLEPPRTFSGNTLFLEKKNKISKFIIRVPTIVDTLLIIVWDSTSKSTEGVFAGRLHHLGNFDECLTATAPFDTHFCLVTIKLDSHILSRSTASDPFEESVFQRLEIYVSC